MPTDLRSTLHDLALTYASEIVTAVRSAPLRELFEPATDADRGSQPGQAWAVTYGLSDAEAGVLRRAAPSSRRTGDASKLQSRIERLRRLAEKPPNDSTRYAIGAIIKELKSDPQTFGESAVSSAAAAIGEDQATLYRFATVAERWTRSEVRALLSREGVSWSHLVALSRVEPAAVRNRLLRKVRHERLTMREFQVLLNRATK